MAADSLYSNHRDQLKGALPPEERIQALENAIREAFAFHIEYRQVGYVQFDQLSANDLAAAFIAYPMIIKPLLASINVGGRAIARDLQISINTYSNTIDPNSALVLAGYVKPMLPREIAIPALVELDRYFWTDKELRAYKGRWEQKVTQQLNIHSDAKFRKRHFLCDAEDFELDAAYPAEGDPIRIGVDVKRIESPRDIHKRSDEILTKAAKFKTTYPGGSFYAVIYYPFPSQQQNVDNRLRGPNIDGVFFAGETDDSIEQAAKLLLGKAQVLKEQGDETIQDIEDETGPDTFVE